MSFYEFKWDPDDFESEESICLFFGKPRRIFASPECVFLLCFFFQISRRSRQIEPAEEFPDCFHNSGGPHESNQDATLAGRASLLVAQALAFRRADPEP